MNKIKYNLLEQKVSLFLKILMLEMSSFQKKFLELIYQIFRAVDVIIFFFGEYV